MYKFIAGFVFFFTYSLSVVFAQNDTIEINSKKPNLILKVNPESLLIGTLDGNIEWFLSPAVSFCLSMSHTDIKVPVYYSLFQSAVDDHYNGNWYNLDFRFYYYKKGAFGAFFAPFYGTYYFNLSSDAGRYNNLSENTINVNATSGTVTGRGEGIIYGMEITHSHFSMDLYIGPSYYTLQETGNYNFGYPFTHFVLRAGFTMGISL